MSNLRQAAEVALKYFEDAHGLEDTEVAIKEALRQALAQPDEVLAEREACAKVCEQLGMATNGMNERNYECAEAIRARGDDLQAAIEKGTKAWADVPNATEWAEELRGYDTPEVTPEVNEPEGWVKIDEVRQYFDSVGCGTIYKTAGEGRVPLYTAPQREWVGLTTAEVIQCQAAYYYDTYANIEAKLKEKNTSEGCA